MLFNSYIFIFIFLPVALVIYFGFNRKEKYTRAKIFLTGMSLWFYAYFNTSYLWIILLSIATNFLCHKVLCEMKEMPSRRKVICGGGVLFNVGLLFYFKYFNFFIENINKAFNMSFTVEKVLLPLGISFFTFQQIAFLIDTYRGEIEEQKIYDYMLFVTFFPQLIAGPIVSHTEMLPQFQNPELKKVDFKNLYVGMCVFVLGLSKKVLLADVLGRSVQWGYEHSELMKGGGAVLLMLMYTLQLYFDFSGYCDMARGIGYMFNIKIPVNFMSPYKSKDILEFWKRWHITLTRFFTRYVYIPLGGNQRSELRTYFNIFIVFLLSGIWHGAGYTFIVWGILHGVLNIITRFIHKHKKHPHEETESILWLNKAKHVVRVIFTFICINILWVFFRADSLQQATELIAGMLQFKNTCGVGELATPFVNSRIEYLYEVLRITNVPYIYYLPMWGYISVGLLIVFGCKNIAEIENKFKPTNFSCMAISLLLFACVMSLSGVSVFLYFNF